MRRKSQNYVEPIFEELSMSIHILLLSYGLAFHDIIASVILVFALLLKQVHTSTCFKWWNQSCPALARNLENSECMTTTIGKNADE
jgi:hypothetical protein